MADSVAGIVLIIVIAWIIYRFATRKNCNKKKTVKQETTKQETDREYIMKTFPNMLESFEEAYEIFSTRKEEVFKYRMIPCVYVVGVPGNSCYRLQIECGKYPDDSWRNYFPAGWDSMILNGKHYIYKNIYKSYGNISESGHWFLDRIAKTHPNWGCSGDAIYMDIMQ